MDSLWTRLKQRKLVQWAVAYVAAAFALLQGVDIIAQQFAWPESVQRGLTLLLVVGFFVALVLAWYHGERGAQKVSGTELLVLSLLLAVGGGFIWQFAPATPPAGQSNATPSRIAVVPAADDNSIAVLPFVNMSSDKEQDYFSDGLSEELLNQLAQIPQLRVIARTSSFSFKGKEVDVATIARALGVAHVLEGSVRKSGDTLRITAQLIRTSDSSHLWSQTYDRSLSDVFEVQDEISTEVVSALKVKLLPEQGLPPGQRTQSVAAYEQFLRGLDVLRNSNLKTAAAEAAFRQAITLDPGYANAYALLGWTQATQAELADNPSTREAMLAQALSSADRAVALAPDIAVGYYIRGGFRLTRYWDWAGADADMKAALRLDPQNPYVLSAYAYNLLAMGRTQEAIAMGRHAVAADPLSDGQWSTLGQIFYFTGHEDEARDALTRSLALNPVSNWPNYLLGVIEIRAGQADAARRHFAGIDDGFRLTGLALLEHRLGHDSASDQALNELRQKSAVGFAFQIACVYAARGDKDEALRWLETAYANHDAGMPRLRIDPMLDSLRDEPRFAELVKKMDFPE